MRIYVCPGQFSMIEISRINILTVPLISKIFGAIKFQIDYKNHEYQKKFLLEFFLKKSIMLVDF